MKLIAIEGVDSVGKETISNLVVNKLITMGYKVGHVSFPRYGTPFGNAIKAFTHGISTDSIRRTPYLSQVPYILDRVDYFSSEMEHLSSLDYLICDRSFYSTYLYGTPFCNKDYEIVEWLNNIYQWEFIESQLSSYMADSMVFLLSIAAIYRNKMLEARGNLDNYEKDDSILNTIQNFAISTNKRESLKQLIKNTDVCPSITDTRRDDILKSYLSPIWIPCRYIEDKAERVVYLSEVADKIVDNILHLVTDPNIIP